MSRVLVVGFDGFDPDLVDAWLSDLPNLAGLMESGIHGPLESIVPPVTPPAWTAMVTGRNPGHFGFTDFTRRVGSTYTDFKLVHSRLVQIPTLHGFLAAAGRRCMMIGVPVAYPPFSIPGGVCVSCFLAPSVDKGITEPRELQEELLAQTSSPYLLDVSLGDSTGPVDRDDLLARVRELDRQRFDITAYLMTAREWDFVFMSCLGTDRIGHYFLRFQDPHHLRHEDDPRYRDAVRNHYRYCDGRLGELISLAGSGTTVLVVSDHGLQRLDGKVNLNDWLAEKGYLMLSGSLDRTTPLAEAPVDWERTRAWSHGYGGQIYLNVRGREAQGCIAPDDADRLLDELEQRLQQEVVGAGGERLEVHVMRRRDVLTGPFVETSPDLFLRIEDYRYLTSDLVGHGTPVTPVSDIPFEDASHAQSGFLAMAGPAVPAVGRYAALHLLDVAPTVLAMFGLPAPEEMEGRVVHETEDVYTEEDEAELTSRLRTLYLE